ncbi:MAG: hypothetical protein D4R64_00650 [Porphyromonadaceae bacterium]|nr:MAG: hypothetical protein D4R64_00650 [Porphyromonadaceae bacterium]
MKGPWVVPHAIYGGHLGKNRIINNQVQIVMLAIGFAVQRRNVFPDHTIVPPIIVILCFQAVTQVIHIKLIGAMQ